MGNIFKASYNKYTTSLVAQRVRHLPAIWQARFGSWVGKIPWKREWQPTPVFLPENPMDGGAWQATVRRVTESDTTEVTQYARTHWSLRIPWAPTESPVK